MVTSAAGEVYVVAKLSSIEAAAAGQVYSKIKQLSCMVAAAAGKVVAAAFVIGSCISFRAT